MSQGKSIALPPTLQKILLTAFLSLPGMWKSLFPSCCPDPLSSIVDNLIILWPGKFLDWHVLDSLSFINLDVHMLPSVWELSLNGISVLFLALLSGTDASASLMVSLRSHKHELSPLSCSFCVLFLGMTSFKGFAFDFTDPSFCEVNRILISLLNCHCVLLPQDFCSSRFSSLYGSQVFLLVLFFVLCTMCVCACVCVHI